MKTQSEIKVDIHEAVTDYIKATNDMRDALRIYRQSLADVYHQLTYADLELPKDLNKETSDYFAKLKENVRSAVNIADNVIPNLLKNNQEI